VSDEFAVPLCRGHHRAVHRSRDERAWLEVTVFVDYFIGPFRSLASPPRIADFRHLV
jgi:hypothetical protein